MWLNAQGVRVKVEIKKLLAVGRACVAIFWPIFGFKGKTFDCLRFSAKEVGQEGGGTLIINFCVRRTRLRRIRRFLDV